MVQQKTKIHVRQYIETYYPEYAGWFTYPPNQCAPIHNTTDEWAIFHNMTPCTIVVEGVMFKCTETLFQLFRFREKEAVKDVYHHNNKIQAKKWIKLGYSRADWGEMFLDVLKFVLMVKYEQSEVFRRELERSKGLFIVEDETNRKSTSYGVQLKESGLYEGSNLMGRLLMELRDNGKLEYKLPDDAFEFIDILKQQ